MGQLEAAGIILQISVFDKVKIKFPMAMVTPLSKILWILTVAICLPLLSSCQYQEPDSRLEQIKHQGVLKVGTRYGMTTYYNGVAGPEGFDYELVKGFAEFLGVRLEIYPYYTLPELFDPLQQGYLDIVAGDIVATPERRQQFKVGPGYQEISQKLVFKQGNKRPRKLRDLQGKLLVIRESAQAESLRTANLDPATNENQVVWNETDDQDAEELLLAVLDEEIDYTIASSNLLDVLRRRHPELSIGFTIEKAQQVAWLLTRDQDDSLFAKVIEYFGEIHSSGQLKVLEHKYFGHVKQFNYVDTTMFLKAAREVLPKFEAYFRQYATTIDWRLIAAMSYQESHWDPLAKSPTGVRGMMMLTLPTAKDWDVTSRLDAEQSIRGGSRYFESLVKRIPERIPFPDRLWFALAAYNIGLGHLEDARVMTQRLGSNPDLWVDVKKHLPLLRQKRYYKHTRFGYARGDEAAQYVENIRRYYDSLVYLYEESPFQDENQPELVTAD